MTVVPAMTISASTATPASQMRNRSCRPPVRGSRTGHGDCPRQARLVLPRRVSGVGPAGAPGSRTTTPSCWRAAASAARPATASGRSPVRRRTRPGEWRRRATRQSAAPFGVHDPGRMSCRRCATLVAPAARPTSNPADERRAREDFVAAVNGTIARRSARWPQKTVRLRRHRPPRRSACNAFAYLRKWSCLPADASSSHSCIARRNRAGTPATEAMCAPDARASALSGHRPGPTGPDSVPRERTAPARAGSALAAASPRSGFRMVTAARVARPRQTRRSRFAARRRYGVVQPPSRRHCRHRFALDDEQKSSRPVRSANDAGVPGACVSMAMNCCAQVGDDEVRHLVASRLLLLNRQALLLLHEVPAGDHEQRRGQQHDDEKHQQEPARPEEPSREETCRERQIIAGLRRALCVVCVRNP